MDGPDLLARLTARFGDAVSEPGLALGHPVATVDRARLPEVLG
jgi:hypothetical protein